MRSAESQLPVAIIASVVAFGVAIGIGGYAIWQEAQTQERVEVIERRLVPVCEQTRSPACQRSLRQAISALTPKQAARIVRKARRHIRSQRRKRRLERRERRMVAQRGGGAQQTPQASQPQRPRSRGPQDSSGPGRSNPPNFPSHVCEKAPKNPHC